MKEVRARRGQSLLDIAMQHCGDAAMWHEVAKANGLEDTWVAEGGEKLEVPAGVMPGVVQMLEREGVVPCTGMDIE